MQKAITVSQLNFYIRSLLEGDTRLSSVSVSGEISNFKLHYGSGHIYFTLKDSGGALKCVMFRANAARLRCQLKDGMKVLCRGRVSVYERDGTYQLYAEDITPDGEGDLMAALEKIKQSLEAQGLFDVSRKKRLPRFPKTIAVITSNTGAAVRDIINVLNRRWPLARVVLVPALVQGADAPKSLISALDRAESSSGADVIIIGRGGGSMEDLWCFNDEDLARRIAKCSIPVISAVGHETDFTICDFVSDMRAPTPSAAAEIAVPDIEEMRSAVSGLAHHIKTRTSDCLRTAELKMQKVGESEAFKNPYRFIAERRTERLKLLNISIKNNFHKLFTEKEKRFSVTAATIDSLSPLKIMARGFISVQTGEKSVRSVEDFAVGDILTLRLADGRAECEVKSKNGEK